MITLKTPAALEAALETAACPTLKQLLTDRLADILTCDLQDLTHVLVMEPGDTKRELRECLGRSPSAFLSDFMLAARPLRTSIRQTEPKCRPSAHGR